MLCLNKRVGSFLVLMSVLSVVLSVNHSVPLNSTNFELVNGSSSNNVFEDEVVEVVGEPSLHNILKDGTSTPPTTTTESETSTILYHWYKLSVPKLILLTLVTLAIPVVFMTLLFWRMHKEKKYLDPNNGALVYRETIIVPSYTIANAQPNPNFNVVQLHNTLFDAPPEYDTAITVKTPEKSESTLPNAASETSNEDDEPPPPSYSTVYI
ncbi:unnamed protein product [Orchesella dallaii]|uniref:Uncharacterized protein n=1 Tax=Orchesella dallaii TaxID=48710 RepID=A0ABP1Q4G5_9HEXA